MPFGYLLVAYMLLCKSLCRCVYRSVRWSVRQSVGHAFEIFAQKLLKRPLPLPTRTYVVVYTALFCFADFCLWIIQFEFVPGEALLRPRLLNQSGRCMY